MRTPSRSVRGAEVDAAMSEASSTQSQLRQEELLTHPVFGVRCVLATNPWLRRNVLEELLGDEDDLVREAAAVHPAMNHEQQLMLARDPSWGVRRSLVNHTRLLSDVQELLLEDPDALVSLEAVRGTALSHVQQERVIERAIAEEDLFLLSGLAGNPCIETTSALMVARRGDRAARATLGKNPAVKPTPEFPAAWCSEHAPGFFTREARRRRVDEETAWVLGPGWEGTLGSLLDVVEVLGPEG